MLDPARYDLATPEGADLGAVLLHPHPSYGGDRHNIVVDALFRALPAAGVAAARFDFSSDDLARGAADAIEAMALLPDGVPRVVVGYSFGAAVGAGVVTDELVGWALVAPPFGQHFAAAGVAGAGDERPKLVLVPTHDQFCPPESARQQLASWTATEIEEIPHADHFLAGATASVAERVVAWVRPFRPGGR